MVESEEGEQILKDLVPLVEEILHPPNEAGLLVRRSDEGRVQRRRWPFIDSLYFARMRSMNVARDWCSTAEFLRSTFDMIATR